MPLEDAVLQVRGQPEPFLRRDENRLTKVAEPDLNPWAKLAGERS